MKNEMEIIFDAVSDNEGFARVAVAAFIAHLNPTLEEMADVKTAVSEAVTNSIIHGYENLKGYGRAERDWEEVHKGKVRVRCILEKEILRIEVADSGKGIEDVKKLWSRFLPPGRSWSAPVWVLPLWRPSWTIWRWRALRGREPWSAWSKK